MVLMLCLDLVEVDAHLGHGIRNVLCPNLDFLEVLTEIQVCGSNLVSNLLAVHFTIAKQRDHIDTLRRSQMDPLKRRIQNRRAVNVLDGVPLHPPLLKRGNPVVVVARIFLDGNHHESASNNETWEETC